MLLQADAAGSQTGSTAQFLVQPPFLPPLSSSLFTLFSVLCLSPALLSLALCVSIQVSRCLGAAAVFFFWSGVRCQLLQFRLIFRLYPADSQQEGSSMSARSGSRFLLVKRECFPVTVLTSGFRLLVADSVKHLERIVL